MFVTFAVLKLDKLNNLITFNYKYLNLSFATSPNISDIYSIDEVDNGYMVIQTNQGEEYIDLLGMLALDRYDKRFVNRAEQILKGNGKRIIKLNGIISPGTYYDYLNQAFLMKNSNVVTKKVYMEE